MNTIYCEVPKAEFAGREIALLAKAVLVCFLARLGNRRASGMDYRCLAVECLNDNAREEFICLQFAGFRVAPLRQDKGPSAVLCSFPIQASLLRSNGKLKPTISALA